MTSLLLRSNERPSASLMVKLFFFGMGMTVAVMTTFPGNEECVPPRARSIDRFPHTLFRAMYLDWVQCLRMKILL